MSENLESQFNAIRLTHETFTFRLEDLFKQILQDSAIDFSQIEARTKDAKSFLEKARQKSYNNPIDEIKDISGIRIITYYQDDAQKIADLVREQFNVDEENSSDKLSDLQTNEFGYRSIHLVCNLDNNRSILPEWAQSANLCFEVQIRTVLQHAWAAISHKLDYKSTSEAPAALQRQLIRLSALLELTDEEFSRIRDDVAKLLEEYERDFDEGNFKVPLDLDSLSEYLKNQGSDPWIELAKSAGISADEPVDIITSTFHLRLIYELLSLLDVQSIDEVHSIINTAKLHSLNPLLNLAEEISLKPINVYDVIMLSIVLQNTKLLPPDTLEAVSEYFFSHPDEPFTRAAES